MRHHYTAVIHCAVVAALFLCAMRAETVEVDTKLGRVKGSLMKTRLGKTIYAFRGIPYAEQPVRFKQARPVKAWDGVLDASNEAPACIQQRGVNMTEDCLTLNVYTRRLANESDSELWPVIVFIHPGGFYKKSSQSFYYGPRYLLDEDIVLVMMNHRLASLGFLNTGDHHAPGNMGMKDVIESLRWVKKYITSFGGDPDSVTLTGQSSGSRAIVAFMVSPMAEGLFHRAIAMSGSSTLPIHPKREDMDLVVKQAKFLNCPTKDLDAMFDCFKKRPAEDFSNSISKFNEWRLNPVTIWYLAIEKEYPDTERLLPDDIETLMKAGKINQVPLMIGVTRDEFNDLYSDALKEASRESNDELEDLNKNWEKLAPIILQYERDTERSRHISRRLVEFYFDNKPFTLNNSYTLGQMYANTLVHFPTYRAASLVSKYSPSPVYFYHFVYESEYSIHPGVGVYHGADLQYLFSLDFFGVPHFDDTYREVKMVRRLTKLWAHFAKTGEPLPRDSKLYGNTVWEPLKPDSKRYLEMGEKFIMRSDFLGDYVGIWDELFPV